MTSIIEIYELDTIRPETDENKTEPTPPHIQTRKERQYATL